MVVKLIQTFKDKINGVRQEIAFKKRAKLISLNIPLENKEHLEKQLQIENEWYGSSYGGFFICPKILNQNSIIYSFGLGRDITFDKKCISKHNCNVFGFDPTPKSIEFVKQVKPKRNFHFFSYGITHAKSGIQTFYLPMNEKATSGSLVINEVVNSDRKIDVNMKTFKDITDELGHTSIDVLKMDIEGSEYEVLNEIITSKFPIGQILVEFHDRLFLEKPVKSKKIVELMKSHGYQIFNHSISFEEISFIHLSKITP